MDIELSSVASDAAATIAAVPSDDPRVDALKAAATSLLPAASFADTDSVEVSLAMSDTPGWAVIRVAKIVPED